LLWRNSPADPGVVYMSKTEMLSFSADRVFDKLMQILEPEEISLLQPIIRDPQLSVALKTERLLDALRGDPVLLILDNFEVMLEENTITHPDFTTSGWMIWGCAGIWDSSD